MGSNAAIAQLNPPPPVAGNWPSSSSCGILVGQLVVVTPSPVCYQSVVTLNISSSIPLDWVYITFGDGRDTIINNLAAGIIINVNHGYNLQPSAKCLENYPTPGKPGTPCPIKAYFFAACGGSDYSYNSTAVDNLVFRYKPKVKFIDQMGNAISGTERITCDSSCVAMIMDSSCTNTYIGIDSTSYTWHWGDGDTFAVTNSTEDYFFNRGHCYQAPTAQPPYYVLKLTAENGCGTSADSIKLYVQEISEFSIPSGNLCTGDQVNIHISASGGNVSANYNTTVTPNSGFTMSGSATADPSITFEVPGQYEITAHYGACSQTRYVNVAPGADLQAAPIPSQCFTGSNSIVLSDWYSTANSSQTNTFILSDTAGQLYAATSSSIPSSPIQLPHPGIYFIYDSSSSMCNSITRRDTFTVFPQTTLTAPPDTVLCIQQVYALPLLDGATVTVEGMGIGNTFVAYPAGQYEVRYTPGCGASVTSTITVAGTEARGIDTVICFASDSISLYGTRPGMAFSGPYVTNGAFNGIAAGTGIHDFYTAFDNGTGCIFRDTATVEILPPMGAVLSFGDTVCSGTATLVLGMDSQFAYEIDWGDGHIGADSMHTYTAAGTYQVLATVSRGVCDTVIGDAIVVIPQADAYFSMSIDSLCYGDTLVLDAPQDPLYVWQWVYGGDTLQPALYAIGNNEGMEGSWDSIGLFASSRYCPVSFYWDSVYKHPRVRAILDLDYDISCNPTRVYAISNSIVANTGDSYLQWYINGQLFLQSGPEVDGVDTLLSAGTEDSTYTIMLVAYSCGTADTAYRTVTVHTTDFIPKIYAPFETCVHTPVVFSSSVIPGCQVSYNFGDGSFSQGSSSMDSLAHTYTVAGQYEVAMAMSCLCQTGYDTVSISVLPGPELSLEVVPQICQGNSIYFNPSVSGTIAATDYLYSFGDGQQSAGIPNPVHVYLEAGVHRGWALAYSGDGCPSDTARFDLSVISLPNMGHSFLDTFACSELLTLLSLDTSCANCTYVWSITGNGNTETAATAAATLPFYAIREGSYLVSAYAFNNSHDTCIAYSDTFKVLVYPSPHAVFVAEATSISGDRELYQFINLSTPSSNSYWWDFGDSAYSIEAAPALHGYIPGSYIPMLTARNGPCVDTASSFIRVSLYPELFVPSAFSPNKDGQNEYFQIFGKRDAIDYMHVSIFDRSGEKVYESFDMEFAWDGTYRSVPLVPATFVYMLEISAADSEEVRLMKGSVTLLR